MLRKVVAVWVSLLIIASSVVILVEIADIVEAPTTLYVGGVGPGNYSKIQWAIDNASDGDTVFVYNGTYFENIIINRSIILLGEDRNNTKIVFVELDSVVLIENDSTVFSRFSVRGNLSIPWKGGIALNNVNDCIITYNNVNNNSNGIFLEFSSNNVIHGNNVSNNYHGITLDSSSNQNNITENIVLFNDGDGIYLDSSSKNNISNNVISNQDISNNRCGIYIQVSPDNNIVRNLVFNNEYGIRTRIASRSNISNNIVRNNRDGIYLSNTRRSIILNNSVTNNTFNGISLDSSSPSFQSTDNDILYNYVSSNFGYGITLSHGLPASSSNNIRYNDLLWNNFGGIHIQSNRNNITNNNISGNLRNGITLIGLMHLKRNNIANNTISNNNWNGIYLKSVSLSNIENNTIFQNNYSGIALDGTISSPYNNIAGNHITENNRDGIELSSTSYNNIDNNNLSNNKNNGVSLGDKFFVFTTSNNITNNQIWINNRNGVYINRSSNNYIMNNTIIDNNISGIILRSDNSTTSYNNTVKNNKISHNKDKGIHIYGGSQLKSNENLLTDNNISNNFYGLFLTSTANNNKIYHNNIINNTIQAIDDTNMGNRWDSGYPEGGNYWSDYIGNDNFKGPHQDIPGSDGIGDTPYIIDGDSQDNYPLIEPHTNRTFENYTVLKQGWNLISIPLIQEIKNLHTVLQMIDGFYDAVQRHDVTDLDDPWKHHKISKPFGNDLFELNETMSFWIHITQPGDTIFLYNGTPPTSNQTIQIHEGWNMVGYPSLTNHNRTKGLNNLEFGIEVDAIQWFDAATKTWHFMGPDDSFVPGRGYWMHSRVDTTWEVPL